MASRASVRKELAALFNFGFRSRELERRHRNRPDHMLVRRNCRRASELENQKFPWPNVSLARRPIAEDLWTSPSRFDRDILHAIHRKGYRRRRDSNSRVEFPERFAVRGAVGGKFSVGAALKHGVSPGGHRPSTLRI